MLSYFIVITDKMRQNIGEVRYGLIKISYLPDRNKDLCFFFVIVVSYFVSGQSSWLQIQRSGFDSRHYQIFWEVVGLERGPLSLVSTTEELLGRKSSGSGLENRKDPSRRPCGTIFPHKLALTSPTSGCRSVDMALSRTEATEFSFSLVPIGSPVLLNPQHTSLLTVLSSTAVPQLQALLLQLYVCHDGLIRPGAKSGLQGGCSTSFLSCSWTVLSAVPAVRGLALLRWSTNPLAGCELHAGSCTLQNSHSRQYPENGASLFGTVTCERHESDFL
jgi:hypothetical protein